jgi:integrase
MSLQEVEEIRMEALRLARQLQDEEGLPGLSRGRRLTVAQLYEEYLGDLRETRGQVLAPRTLAGYEEVWRLYLLPAVGGVSLAHLTVDMVRQIKRDIPPRVLERRPGAKGGGRYMANAVLQQLSAAMEFAWRMEWVTRNVASAKLVPRYEQRRSEDFLDAPSYAEIGRVLREFEANIARGEFSPLSLRTIFALRICIFTGVRHRSELLWTQLAWCKLENSIPRIGIPRAKGDRGTQGGGRWIYLGTESVRLLRAMPRPLGSEHLTVPGDKPGRPLFRLNEAWRLVLQVAGLSQVPVKTLRHGFSTHSAGIIAPEHRAQLLGHQGRPMTDTVYLHRHGPDLARAAELVEQHLRTLLGDLPSEKEGFYPPASLRASAGG